MKQKSGFTLIELLVVIAIIGILATLLFPLVSKVTNASKHSKQASNMRQAGAASLSFAADNNGRLPFLWVNQTEGSYQKDRSWHYFIAPYLGMEDYQWWQSQYHGLNGKGVPIWVGPYYDFACWSFSMNETRIRKFSDDKFINNEILGGARAAQIEQPSRTILFAEVKASPKEPGGGAFVGGVYRNHPGLQQERQSGRSAYTMVDGSVKLMTPTEANQSGSDHNYWTGGMQ